MLIYFPKCSCTINMIIQLQNVTSDIQRSRVLLLCAKGTFYLKGILEFHIDEDNEKAFC